MRRLPKPPAVRLGLAVLAAAALGLAALGAAGSAEGRADRAAAAKTSVVFTRHCGSGCNDVFVVSADGTGLRRLTTGSSSFDPAFTPQGHVVVFASDRRHTGAAELFSLRLDGHGLRRLTSVEVGEGRFQSDANPAPSPDGRLIAFARTTSDASGSRTDLYLLDLRARSLRRLTRDGGSSEPAWSPDSRRLAFTRRVDGRPSVVVLDTVSRAERKLAAGAEQPAWSPDGRTIVWVAADRSVAVAAISADGSGMGPARTLAGTAGAVTPAFSPDGRVLVYSRPDGTRRHALFTKALARPAATARLTRPGDLRSDFAPAWATGGAVVGD